MGTTRKRLDIARVIHDARQEKGLTQTELAERVGCHVSTVCGWESDSDRKRGSAHLMRTIRLLKELDLNPAKLA
jgi:transcriptional regulator with XRE-family HTH domain